MKADWERFFFRGEKLLKTRNQRNLLNSRGFEFPSKYFCFAVFCNLMLNLVCTFLLPRLFLSFSSQRPSDFLSVCSAPIETERRRRRRRRQRRWRRSWRFRRFRRLSTQHQSEAKRARNSLFSRVHLLREIRSSISRSLVWRAEEQLNPTIEVFLIQIYFENGEIVTFFYFDFIYHNFRLEKYK